MNVSNPMFLKTSSTSSRIPRLSMASACGYLVPMKICPLRRSNMTSDFFFSSGSSSSHSSPPNLSSPSTGAYSSSMGSSTGSTGLLPLYFSVLLHCVSLASNGSSSVSMGSCSTGLTYLLTPYWRKLALSALWCPILLFFASLVTVDEVFPEMMKSNNISSKISRLDPSNPPLDRVQNGWVNSVKHSI